MTNLAVVAESSISFAVANLSISARVFFCPPSSHHDFGPILIVCGPDAAGIHMRHFFFCWSANFVLFGFSVSLFFFFGFGPELLSSLVMKVARWKTFSVCGRRDILIIHFDFGLLCQRDTQKKNPAKKRGEKSSQALWAACDL